MHVAEIKMKSQIGSSNKVGTEWEEKEGVQVSKKCSGEKAK